MCNLFCNIVKLFNLVVACCAKTDCIKLRMSYAIQGIYGLSVTTFLHLQRPDLLNNRQGHPKGIIEKKTWKLQQSMLNTFWSHFKHFWRLLGNSYLFHTPSKTDGRVPSQQGALTPGNLTYWEASQLTFVQPLLTSLGGQRAEPFNGGRGVRGREGGAGFWQITHSSNTFLTRTLFRSNLPACKNWPGIEEQIFLRNSLDS